MSGIKGMKWKKPPEQVRQIYTGVDKETFLKIEKRRKKASISRSAYVYNIILEFLSKDD